jgi:hypothetical protein
MGGGVALSNFYCIETRKNNSLLLTLGWLDLQYTVAKDLQFPGPRESKEDQITRIESILYKSIKKLMKLNKKL